MSMDFTDTETALGMRLMSVVALFKTALSFVAFMRLSCHGCLQSAQDLGLCLSLTTPAQ